jgi:hypothetical protein
MSRDHDGAFGDTARRCAGSGSASRLHRKKLADRIAYFERNKLIPAAWRGVVNSDRLDQKWFDLGLFTFVLRHADLFTQRARHRALRVAFKFAKGAAWYRANTAWRQWLASMTGA